MRNITADDRAGVDGDSPLGATNGADLLQFLALPYVIDLHGTALPEVLSLPNHADDVIVRRMPQQGGGDSP